MLCLHRHVVGEHTKGKRKYINTMVIGRRCCKDVGLHQLSLHRINDTCLSVCWYTIIVVELQFRSVHLLHEISVLLDGHRVRVHVFVRRF